MRLLILAKRFSKDGSSKWLVDELADEFVERGWEVQVILFDLQGQWGYGQHKMSGNISVYAIPLLEHKSRSWLKKYPIFFLHWIKALVDIKRQDFGDFDLLINFSIASIFYGIARHFIRKNSGMKSLLILWDFFPVHQKEIGKIGSRLLCRVFYRLENKEILSYQSVALMSERNIEFFRHYHTNYTGLVFKLPVWGKDEGQIILSGRVSEYVVPGKFNVVFGGQLAKGRGIVQLLDFVRDYGDELNGVVLLIVGDGELRPYIESRIAEEGLRSIKLLQKMDRQSYMVLISACQAGLVVTVPGVSVPTFPSKVIDYMKARLPVLASVEPTTDFGDYVENVAQCGLMSDAGDNLKLYENLMVLKDDPGLCSRLGVQGYTFFKDYFAVSRVVDRLFSELGLSRIQA